MALARYAEKYTKELRRLIEPLFVEKKIESPTLRCCLNLNNNDISLVRISNTLAGKELIGYDTLQYDNLENLPLILSAFLDRYDLAATPTYWLLSPEDYQLFLIESLPVKSEEFHEALNWRVRSLINYPIEEAVIDYFMLPAKKSAADSMVVAIATKRTALVNMIGILKKSGVHLTTIDIPELAMRNLAALYENDEKSTAFIYINNNIATLNISREKTLYFTRRIKITNEYEQLCLELLRYFDYFQSQWRHPSPTRIFVAAHNQNSDDIAKKLSEYLLLTVEPFKIKSITANPTLMQSLEKNNLLTLGCALREEINHATPRN